MSKNSECYHQTTHLSYFQACTGGVFSVLHALPPASAHWLLSRCTAQCQRALSVLLFGFRHPPPAASSTSISPTLTQWGSFSALVAVSLQELRVCLPSLHYVNKHFVHNRRLWPHLEETPLVCRPFPSKLTFRFTIKHDLTCLCCLNSTFVWLENSLWSFSLQTPCEVLLSLFCTG